MQLCISPSSPDGASGSVRVLIACFVVQEAAGVFAYIGEHLVPRLETPYPTDLSPESCGMLSTLCLSQVLSICMPSRKRQALYTCTLCMFTCYYVAGCFGYLVFWESGVFD